VEKESHDNITIKTQNNTKEKHETVTENRLLYYFALL